MKKRSKRKTTLKLLEYAANAAANIKHWPRYESSFSSLSVQLSHALSSAVMDNAWDASSLVNWEWDAYHEVFTFDVLSVFRMGPEISSRPVRMSSGFRFDPHKDLLEELDRVSDEIKKYADNLLLMQRAYHEARKAGRADALDADD